MRAVILATLVSAACSGSSGDGPVASAAPEPTPATAPAAKASRLTVASYNINAGMSGNDVTLKAIRALDADIIVLQEITRQWWPAIESRESHPHKELTIDPRHHYGGLAVLSRYPIRDSKVLRGGPGPFVAWRGTVDTPAGAIQLVNVHLFPPVVWFRERGIMRAYKDSQKRHRKELEAHLRQLDAESPTIIAGDFNESRTGDAVQWLMAQGFSTSHEGREPTWRWKLREGVEVDYQLDHIMIKQLTAANATVIKAGASDHFPITATLSPIE